MISVIKQPLDANEVKQLNQWLVDSQAQRARDIVSSRIIELQVEMANVFAQKGEKEGFQGDIADAANNKLLPLRHFLQVFDELASTTSPLYTVQTTVTYAPKH